MRFILPALVALLFLPATSYAAHTPSSFSEGQQLLIASSSPGNVYAAGASVVVAAPVAGDLSVVGGSIISATLIAGDELFLGGSISSRSHVDGNLRVAGGTISVDDPVGGDLVAFGLSVDDLGSVGGSVFIVAADTELTGGADGPVIIYGNNVSLGGTFGGDVTVVASGRVALAAGTKIAGKLTYQSPEEAIVPSSAVVHGGVLYTNASYLPDVGTSRILSLISIGVFLVIRVLGALILAGLFAGLFPRLNAQFVEDTVNLRPSRILLTTLLGLAVFIATPVLALLLMITFVGIGLALLFLIVYAFLALLALLYAGILIGALIARRFSHRTLVLWHDGVLGMLILSIITLVPYIGLFVALLVTAFSAGMLLIIFFNFAFPHEGHTTELL
jgi:hypothetical protein